MALGVMGIGLFAITPLADRGVQAELRAEKMHNIGVRVTDVPLTAGLLDDLKSLDNVDQMSPQAELPVTIEIGGRMLHGRVQQAEALGSRLVRPGNEDRGDDADLAVRRAFGGAGRPAGHARRSQSQGSGGSASRIVMGRSLVAGPCP